MEEDKNYLPPSVGTTLKIAVTADIGNDKHLADGDINFECMFHVDGMSSKKQTCTKEEMIYLDDDTYMAVVDSANIGVGKYYCLLTVWIPDEDAPDNIRVEKVRFPTNINVVK
jgi:hypothetical protein